MGQALWTALRSGRFVSWWTIAISLPLSLTAMAPNDAHLSASGALATAALTWVTFAAGLGAIAVAERRIRDTHRRALSVGIGVVGWAAVRPVIGDLWWSALADGSPSASTLPARIATNVIVWSVVVAVTAIVLDATRSLATTNALLRTALAEWEASGRRATAFEAAARAAVTEAAQEVRDAAASLDGPAGAEPLPALGAQLRTRSHELATRAAQTRGDGETDPAAHSTAESATARATQSDTRSAAPRRIGLRVLPKSLVATLATVSVLPYAVRSATLGEIAIGILALALAALLIDGVPRLRWVIRRGWSLWAYLLLSGVAAAGFAAIVRSEGASLVLTAITAASWLAIAVGAAVCEGALHALRLERHRLSGALAGAQRALRAGERPAREALSRAAELLHRDGQGSVVRLTASGASTDADRAALGRELRELAERLDGAFDAPLRPASASLSALLATWRRVLDLGIEISPDARAALERSATAADDAYDVVAEGLLNAVKHGAQRRAEVRIDLRATGAGSRVRVRVRSAGSLRPGTTLGAASALRDRGARLHEDGGIVTLEALLDPAPGERVVSAEHPR